MSPSGRYLKAACRAWRSTDRVEVFAHPERTPKGDLTTLFLARGIRHLPGAAEAVDGIQKGGVLKLDDEPGNPVNRRAVLISTCSGRRVGWVPDCLVEMIHELRYLEAGLEVTAEHVNPADVAAPHMRLLCRLRSPGYRKPERLPSTTSEAEKDPLFHSA